jgi:hypothetical protein
VFDSTWTLLSHAQKGDTTEEHLALLRAEAREIQNHLPEALFLFGFEIEDYLRTIMTKCTRLQQIAVATRNNDSVMPANMIEEDLALNLWFDTEALSGVRAKFAPYLDFSEWQ